LVFHELLSSEHAIQPRLSTTQVGLRPFTQSLGFGFSSGSPGDLIIIIIDCSARLTTPVHLLEPWTIAGAATGTGRQNNTSAFRYPMQHIANRMDKVACRIVFVVHVYSTNRGSVWFVYIFKRLILRRGGAGEYLW